MKKRNKIDKKIKKMKRIKIRIGGYWGIFRKCQYIVRLGGRQVENLYVFMQY